MIYFLIFLAFAMGAMFIGVGVAMKELALTVIGVICLGLGLCAALQSVRSGPVNPNVERGSCS